MEAVAKLSTVSEVLPFTFPRLYAGGLFFAFIIIIIDPSPSITSIEGGVGRDDDNSKEDFAYLSQSAGSNSY
ncbi:MAG: hypothetical protein LBE17_04120 [Treponema sp.]|nr:hypothetical protein [Treponema sp.]